jgi:pyridoxamine 5'-phosphate oxidase
VTRRTPNQHRSNLDLAGERREYLGQRLLEGEAPAEPYELFTSWLEQALAARLLDATAMILSTANRGGAPSARVVLLKGHDVRGLVFYTRHHAQKVAELAENPRASCLFHWRELDRQVRIEGSVESVSRDESRAYFASRPRSSQLAARATSGLERVTAAELEEHFAAATQEWDGRDVEMPADWGGFRVHPLRVEFWQGRPNRLHDRLVYEQKGEAAWERYRLAP